MSALVIKFNLDHIPPLLFNKVDFQVKLFRKHFSGVIQSISNTSGGSNVYGDSSVLPLSLYTSNTLT